MAHTWVVGYREFVTQMRYVICVTCSGEMCFVSKHVKRQPRSQGLSPFSLRLRGKMRDPRNECGKILGIEHGSEVFWTKSQSFVCPSIGPLQDPVTWYGINYIGTQMTQWTFKTKESLPVQPVLLTRSPWRRRVYFLSITQLVGQKRK